MKEQQSKTPNSCLLIGSSSAEDGQITSAHIKITREGNLYMLSVATPQYALELKQHNSNLPEELQLEDKFYILSTIPPGDELCDIIAQIPTKDLEPFKIEISEEPTAE